MGAPELSDHLEREVVQRHPPLLPSAKSPVDDRCVRELATLLHRGPRAVSRGSVALPEDVYERVATGLIPVFDGVQPSEEWVGWFVWQMVIDLVAPQVGSSESGQTAGAICRLLAVDNRSLDQQMVSLTPEQAVWVQRATRVARPALCVPAGSQKVRVALAYVGQPAGRVFAGGLHQAHMQTAAAFWRVIRGCLAREDAAASVRYRVAWLLAQGNTDPQLGAVRQPRHPGVTGPLDCYQQHPDERQAPDLSWVDALLTPGGSRTTYSPPVRELTFDRQDFFSRLQSASQTLDLASPITRQAAVLDIANMADSHPQHRQACIDLLCSYMRTPIASGLDHDVDVEVRRTIVESIRDRLVPSATVSWAGCNLNFTGAVIASGDFSHAVFTGGIVYFDDVRFDARWFSFDNAEFSGGTVSFTGAQFNGKWMSFAQASFSGATVWFTNAAATKEGGTLTFKQARFTGGHIGMENMTITDGCNLLTDDATGDIALFDHALEQLIEALRVSPVEY